MSLFSYVPSRLLKGVVALLAALLLIHYWVSVAIETHPVQPLFVINSALDRMRVKHASGNLTGFAVETSGYFNDSSSHNISVNGALGMEFSSRSNESVLCPPVPPHLKGRIKIRNENIDLQTLEKEFPELEPGGVYRPKECKARYVIALVIPFRDRQKHLQIFLNNMHRFLMKQQIDYEIFVVEQATGLFNRGKLFNVGFVEALKIKNFDCFIFHDVDLIPEDDRNLYTCPHYPRHMSVAIDYFNYRLPYSTLFGGVSAMSTNHFKLVNGFSNMFWGWGGEDDDMFNRLRRKNLHISRYPPTYARYTMLKHIKQTPNPKRFEILLNGKKRFSTDGLNSLKYQRKELELKRLYTWILVDLQPPR